MPGTAEVVLFGEGAPTMPVEPPAVDVPTREPGVFLDDKTISWLGRPTDPVVALPVDANDIRRWAMAVYYPDAPPDAFFDLDDIGTRAVGADWSHHVTSIPRVGERASTPSPTRGCTRGWGNEPGHAASTAVSAATYFAPIRVGDVSCASRTLVDTFEKDGRLGTMLFLVDGSRWTNQRGELVKLGLRTSIYH